jgi:hypothetical protein
MSLRPLMARAASLAVAAITLLCILLQPAYANGGHMHLGSVFFLLLGGVAFIGGLSVVIYLLLRPAPEEGREESEPD